MALTDDNGVGATMLVSPTGMNNGGFGNGFGGDGWWVLLLFLLIGGNGWGNGFGGGFGGGNDLYPWMNQNNPYNNFMKQFNEFKKTIHGNPQEQIQQLMNSGKITQAQYNQAVQKANMIKSMFGIK